MRRDKKSKSSMNKTPLNADTLPRYDVYIAEVFSGVKNYYMRQRATRGFEGIAQGELALGRVDVS